MTDHVAELEKAIEMPALPRRVRENAAELVDEVHHLRAQLHAEQVHGRGLRLRALRRHPVLMGRLRTTAKKLAGDLPGTSPADTLRALNILGDDEKLVAASANIAAALNLSIDSVAHALKKCIDDSVFSRPLAPKITLGRDPRAMAKLRAFVNPWLEEGSDEDHDPIE